MERSSASERSDGATDMDKPVILLGGGHAHVEVVRQFGLQGMGREIVLISPSHHAPYSGMLPGYVAGQYGFDDFHIDLLALCARHGVHFLTGMVVDIDPERRRVTLADGKVLDYSLLSVDIGSTPALPDGVEEGIAVKPIATFTERLSLLDSHVSRHARPITLAVVGQGVAGVEMAFALQRRFGRGRVRISLLGRAAQPVAERSPIARWLVQRALHRAGIAHLPRFDAMSYSNGRLVASDGRDLLVDEVIWTTSSGAPHWLRQTGLALDASGFIQVDETLRSISHPEVFAAGDVASLSDPRPKAGVFAVRQGPILAENLRLALSGGPLRPYRPQRAWLALISLADGRAVADKWGLAVSGRWVAAWKHQNDTRFLKRYRP